jgi:site-specific recombinase XerD
MNTKKWIEKYSIDCRLKYNSINTQENYISQVKSFLYYFTNDFREPKEIPTGRIKLWLLDVKSPNTRNHRLCAVKSFYQLTVKMPMKIDKIPFTKKDKQLPIVLSVEEIQRMFDVCDNSKHRVILSTLYSCGLRVSELINLKWANIDRSRMIINVIAGKGNKDRQVVLSPQLIPILEDYYREYKSKEYVLNGQFKLQYSSRSVLQVVKQLAVKVGIGKRVYSHLIRHCTMTHLLEQGTDLGVLQKLCGHNNPRTTLIYTHISHNLISKINSPLNQIKF